MNNLLKLRDLRPEELERRIELQFVCFGGDGTGDGGGLNFGGDGTGSGGGLAFGGDGTGSGGGLAFGGDGTNAGGGGIL